MSYAAVVASTPSREEWADSTPNASEEANNVASAFAPPSTFVSKMPPLPDMFKKPGGQTRARTNGSQASPSTNQPNNHRIFGQTISQAGKQQKHAPVTLETLVEKFENPGTHVSVIKVPEVSEINNFIALLPGPHQVMFFQRIAGAVALIYLIEKKTTSADDHAKKMSNAIKKRGILMSTLTGAVVGPNNVECPFTGNKTTEYLNMIASYFAATPLNVALDAITVTLKTGETRTASTILDAIIEEETSPLN